MDVPAMITPEEAAAAAMTKKTAAATVTQLASPSTPSVKLVPFTVATAMKTSAAVFRIPRSITCPGMKGIFMVRGMECTFCT